MWCEVKQKDFGAWLPMKRLEWEGATILWLILKLKFDGSISAGDWGKEVVEMECAD